MSENVRTEKATQKKIEIGEETSRKLLTYLKENPDKTIYELSKTFHWKIGKVQKALHRIESCLGVEQDIKGGRLKKRYYVISKS